MEQDAGLFELPKEASFASPKKTPANHQGLELSENPVVQVHILGLLPHLDKPYEYLLPSKFAHAKAGMRVRVKFSGREKDAFIRKRYQEPLTDRQLLPITKLVSEIPVLSEAIFELCEDIANRYGGTMGDVLRLAVPARNAGVEKKILSQIQAATSTNKLVKAAAQDSENHYLTKYPLLETFCQELKPQAQAVPRAAIILDPIDSFSELVAALVTKLSELNILILVADQRDLDRLDKKLRENNFQPIILAASQGPQARYRNYLKALYQAGNMVIGTRSAAFAPIPDLHLIIMWDESDDSYHEPRAPYPHYRSVVLARSYLNQIPLLFINHSPTPSIRHLINQNAIHLIPQIPAKQIEYAPRIEIMDEYLREREGSSAYGRLSDKAIRTIRSALKLGPVLVQVPRSGYASALNCVDCKLRARCHNCNATLIAPNRFDYLKCQVCARQWPNYECKNCQSRRFKPVVMGSARLSEELQKAFPQAKVRTSGAASGIIEDEDVQDEQIIVATPGAEPHLKRKYAAAILMDADLALSRPAYDTDVQVVGRFRNAISLVRPATEEGRVLVSQQNDYAATRSLLLPRSFAYIDEILLQREELHLPPYYKILEISGTRSGCHWILDNAQLPPEVEHFGPSSDEETSRVIFRCPLNNSREMINAIRGALNLYYAKKLPGPLKLQVDPLEVF